MSPGLCLLLLLGLLQDQGLSASVLHLASASKLLSKLLSSIVLHLLSSFVFHQKSSFILRLLSSSTQINALFAPTNYSSEGLDNKAATPLTKDAEAGVQDELERVVSGIQLVWNDRTKCQ